MIIYLVKWYCGIATWESTFIGKKALDDFLGRVAKHDDKIIYIKEVGNFDI